MNVQINNKGVTGQYTKNGVPSGFTAITPFIVVKNPIQAIEFYKTVFDANIRDITEFSDEHGNKSVVHAELDFGNGILQIGVSNPAYKLGLPPEGDQACYSLALYVTDVDGVFEQAIAEGATAREPIANFVSGDRFGSILDPFGVRWTIMTRIEDLSEEESRNRVRTWACNFTETKA